MTPPPARRVPPSAPPPPARPASSARPIHPALAARHPEITAELGNPKRTTLWIVAVVSKALKEGGASPIPYWKDGQPWADKTPDEALSHARYWVTVNEDWPPPSTAGRRDRLARKRASAPPALRASWPTSGARPSSSQDSSSGGTTAASGTPTS